MEVVCFWYLRFSCQLAPQNIELLAAPAVKRQMESERAGYTPLILVLRYCQNRPTRELPNQISQPLLDTFYH